MNPDLRATLILTGVVTALSLAGLAGLAHGAEGDDCDGSLHCFLTRLPRHTTDADEKPLEREQRLREKAEAIKAATPKDTERAWLLMTGTRESHWARFVDLDLPRCRDGHDGRCDGGKAWSVWQLQGTNREGGATVAAKTAIEVFRRGANYCKARGYDYWEGGTAMYAKGGSCEWPEAESRVRQMWRIWGQIQ